MRRSQFWAPAQRSGARIDILEAHDVVFAQIIATLYFDDFNGLFGHVLEAMLRAQWNEYGFILAQVENIFSARDAGGSEHHYPVLGATMMHLQRQACSGVDTDAFDLKTRTALDGVIPAPRAVDLARCGH